VKERLSFTYLLVSVTISTLHQASGGSNSGFTGYTMERLFSADSLIPIVTGRTGSVTVKSHLHDTTGC